MTVCGWWIVWGAAGPVGGVGCLHHGDGARSDRSVLLNEAIVVRLKRRTKGGPPIVTAEGPSHPSGDETRRGGKRRMAGEQQAGGGGSQTLLGFGDFVLVFCFKSRYRYRLTIEKVQILKGSR